MLEMLKLFEKELSEGKLKHAASLRTSFDQRLIKPESEPQISLAENDTLYLGGSRNSKKHGWGVFCDLKHNFFKIGQWVADNRTGYGYLLDFFEKRSYMGWWKNGACSGLGKLKCVDWGYDGHWKKGQKHGLGKLSTYSCRQEITVRQAEFKGVSTSLYPNRKTMIECWFSKGEILPTEDVKVSYPSGDVYEGKWSNGQRNGYGEVKHPNGTWTKCFWKDDKRIEDNELETR
jgi:hypothetical protein